MLQSAGDIGFLPGLLDRRISLGSTLTEHVATQKNWFQFEYNKLPALLICECGDKSVKV